MVQLILAVNHYEMAHSAYPPGTVDQKGPIQNTAKGYHHSWISQILPYIEQRNAYLAIDRTVSVYDRKNVPVRDLGLAVLNCASTPGFSTGYSNYAGLHHDTEAPIDVNNNGIFFLNSNVRFDDVLDGASQTFFIGEKVVQSGDLGWMSGTNATMRNTGTPLVAGRFGAGIRGPGGLPSKSADDPNEFLGMGMMGMGGGFYKAEGAAAGSAASAEPSGESPPPTPESAEPTTPAPSLEAAPPGEVAPATTSTTDAAPSSPSPEEEPDRRQTDAKQAANQTAALLLVGGFGSFHSGVVNFAFGDGSVRSISLTINGSVYQQLGHRADGKLLSNASY
jgi:prepilin-type processing-associated H-X9-DG protein